MAFRFENVAIDVKNDENGVLFLVGEVVTDNKMRITHKFDNLYQAWAIIMREHGHHTRLPKKLEQYL